MSRRSKRSKVVVSPPTSPTPPVTAAFPAQTSCLNNPDLLGTILRHLDDAENPRANRGSLHAVALTCSALSPSAVKILWERIDNFLPLLRLLPTFQYNDDIHQYELGGIVADSDWEVLERRAANVREVCYVNRSTRQIHPVAYLRLATRKQPLLANLQRLDLSSSYCPDAEMLLCLSPSITSLKLACTASSTSQTFLELLAADAPYLLHLSLSGARKMPATDHLFRNLKTMVWTDMNQPVTSAALLQIGSIPQLHFLKTDVENWDKAVFESIAHASIFWALTKLEISAKMRLHTVVPAFLLRIGSPNLQSISMTTRYHDYDRLDNTDCTAAFTTVAECLVSRWAASLTHFELCGMPTSFEHLPSLNGLGRLRTLTLDCNLRGALSDERMLALVATWPSLETLTLASGGADIAFLQALAAHCPALQTLRVPCVPDEIPDLPDTPVRAHALRELRFAALEPVSYKWRQVDVHLLARHIDRLFPQVASIGGEGYQNRWREVEKLVKMCQDVRRIGWEH
ncbi:hypothetical protein GGX14DRAFT_443584 [Mycena pura]|uniref:F-box domain-containing protein n=1 Tax=Mycena pura TaxID=153505 RepID=A0AAD6VJV5_9AGAR|nr:hypothetical protein GGX14DRAFT_443584 [Mycena pura]